MDSGKATYPSFIAREDNAHGYGLTLVDPNEGVYYFVDCEGFLHFTSKPNSHGHEVDEYLENMYAAMLEDMYEAMLSNQNYKA